MRAAHLQTLVIHIQTSFAPGRKRVQEDGLSKQVDDVGAA